MNRHYPDDELYAKKNTNELVDSTKRNLISFFKKYGLILLGTFDLKLIKITRIYMQLK